MEQQLTISPIPAFNDNYLWLLARGQSAVVVDPGDADPVRRTLDERELDLGAILVTHHHGDHVGGVAALKARYGARVYGPAAETIPGIDRRLVSGDHVEVLGLDFRVIEVPGHTSGHIAYYTDAASTPLLFCGDTMFACGCGRLFEGTAQQMLTSLDSLAALPGETRMFCAHEYTLANIRFALTVDPGNAALQERARTATATRARNEPTVPSTVALERATNPFLRCDAPAVKKAVASHAGGRLSESDRVAVFAELRSWKDNFR